MLGQTDRRKRCWQAMLCGVFLTSCLLVLVGVTPVTAVVPSNAASDGTLDGNDGWASSGAITSPGAIDPIDRLGSALGASDGHVGGGGRAGEAGARPDGWDRGPGEPARVAVASADTTDCDGASSRTDAVPDGTHTAVLDRIEDDLAVLEVSGDANSTHELVVEVRSLPADGRHPNAVFEVRVTDGELRDATYDASRSEARFEEAQDRFDGLASKPREENEGEDDDGE